LLIVNPARPPAPTCSRHPKYAVIRESDRGRPAGRRARVYSAFSAARRRMCRAAAQECPPARISGVSGHRTRKISYFWRHRRCIAAADGVAAWRQFLRLCEGAGLGQRSSRCHACGWYGTAGPGLGLPRSGHEPTLRSAHGLANRGKLAAKTVLKPCHISTPCGEGFLYPENQSAGLRPALRVLRVR
jgi:hypothetical protein